MSSYKKVVMPDGKVSFTASDSTNKVEFVIKTGIPQNVIYGKEHSNMKRDIGDCYRALSLLVTISMDCFIELVQELNVNTFCYRRAISMLKK